MNLVTKCKLAYAQWRIKANENKGRRSAELFHKETFPEIKGIHLEYARLYLARREEWKKYRAKITDKPYLDPNETIIDYGG